MALRLYPFRQYNDSDVVNLFANNVVDDNPTTNGNGSAGVMVKVLKYFIIYFGTLLNKFQ